LVNNIRKNGLTTPLLCRRGKRLENDYIDQKSGKAYPLYQWIIVDGESRFRAINILLEEGVKFPRGIAVRNVPQNSNEANWTMDMLNCNESKKLEPIELAKAYQRCQIAYNWSVQYIADGRGKSVTHVINTLAILGETPEVITAVKEGKATLANVRHINKEVKEDGIVEKVDRREEVARRLRNMIERVSTANENGEKMTVTSLIKNTVKKADNEILAEQLDAVLNALPPHRTTYTRDELEKMFDLLSEGHPIKNTINLVFGTQPVGATGTDGE
jgi:ParB-like chromosome segregation protein Spo0J